MKLIKHTVRLSADVEKAVLLLAEERDMTPYAMLPHCVEAGVAALAKPPAEGSETRELVAEVASISTRLVDVEHMLDRTLFTACAAYCYARSASMGDEKTDEDISAETNRAYDRQRAAMEERP